MPSDAPMQSRLKAGRRVTAAWEEWFKNSGQVLFTPDGKLIPVPAAAPAK